MRITQRIWITIIMGTMRKEEPGNFKPRMPNEMGIDIGWIIISDTMEHLWNNCHVHMQSSTIEEDNHG